MDIESEIADWFLNVWDELGEDTTREDIVRDFEDILKDRTKAERIVDAWFQDHAKLLPLWTKAENPALGMIAYEQGVINWVKEKLK